MLLAHYQNEAKHNKKLIFPIYSVKRIFQLIFICDASPILPSRWDGAAPNDFFDFSPVVNFFMLFMRFHMLTNVDACWPLDL